MTTLGPPLCRTRQKGDLYECSQVYYAAKRECPSEVLYIGTDADDKVIVGQFPLNLWVVE